MTTYAQRLIKKGKTDGWIAAATAMKQDERLARVEAHLRIYSMAWMAILLLALLAATLAVYDHITYAYLAWDDDM